MRIIFATVIDGEGHFQVDVIVICGTEDTIGYSFLIKNFYQENGRSIYHNYGCIELHRNKNHRVIHPTLGNIKTYHAIPRMMLNKFPRMMFNDLE